MGLFGGGGGDVEVKNEPWKWAQPYLIGLGDQPGYIGAGLGMNPAAQDYYWSLGMGAIPSGAPPLTEGHPMQEAWGPGQGGINWNTPSGLPVNPPVAPLEQVPLNTPFPGVSWAGNAGMANPGWDPFNPTMPGAPPVGAQPPTQPPVGSEPVQPPAQLPTQPWRQGREDMDAKREAYRQMMAGMSPDQKSAYFDQRQQDYFNRYGIDPNAIPSGGVGFGGTAPVQTNPLQNLQSYGQVQGWGDPRMAQELYNLAQQQGYSASTVDQMLGLAPGTSQTWLNQQGLNNPGGGLY